MMFKFMIYGLRAVVFLWLLFGGWGVGAALALADSSMLEYDGLIEPYRVVEVGSEVTGVLDSVEIERGDMVKAGQVVATLRSGVEAANLELARARAEMDANVQLKRSALEFARRNSQRIKDLYDVKAVAFQKWDEVETQRIMAENELMAALEQKQLYELEFRHADEVLRRKTIQSPVTGVIMERYLSKGEYVENKPILKIAQINPLNVEVVMPVSQIGRVKVGMKARVKPEDPVGGDFQAVVTIVDKVMDAASGTFGVRLEISNPRYRIPPGLKCKVLFRAP